MLQRDQGVLVLRQLVSFDTKSTHLLFCQFRCMQSGLLSFLDLDKVLFEDYIKKVFFSPLSVNSDLYCVPSVLNVQ